MTQQLHDNRITALYCRLSRIKIKITTFQIIIYAFALTILTGSLCLSLVLTQTHIGTGYRMIIVKK